MIHAFISDARLYVRTEDGQVKEITSPFAERKVEDAERRNARNAWKAESGDSNNPYASSSLIWGRQARSQGTMTFRFKDVMVADRNTLYYILTNDLVTGLFRYELGTGDEYRLFHTNRFREDGMDFSPARNEFIASVETDDGRANLEVLNSDGRSVRVLTDGDSRDVLPSFSRSDSNKILFQSSGIARHENGEPMAYGPAAVCSLNLETNRLEELLTDNRYDYLLPREDTQGRLYCIRRPYEAVGVRGHLSVVKDVILFPIRLISAIIGFLTAFIRLFDMSGLKTAGPEVRERPKNKYVRVLGQTIDVAKASKGGRSKEGPSLVPGSWELVRMDPSGELEVIRKKVSAYDIDSEGHVICTNGFRVHRVASNGSELAFKHNLIQTLRIAE